MNSLPAKKWFVYVQDHHEGPFSVAELQQRRNSGLTEQSFVWAEGMADWLTIAEIPQLKYELFPANPSKQEAKPEPTSVFETAPVVSLAAKKDSSPQPYQDEPIDHGQPNKQSNKKTSPGKSVAIALSVVVTAVTIVVLGLVAASHFAPESIHSMLRPTLARMVAKVPPLGKITRLVPHVSDVAPEDLAELESSLQVPAETEVRLTVVLSHSDPARPSFYIATNLPSDTVLNIVLLGNGDTLLNELSYAQQSSVKVRNGFAKTDAFSDIGGRAIAKGEYQLRIYESTNQSDDVQARLLTLPSTKAVDLPQSLPSSPRFAFGKTFFLGGDRDQTYLARLKAFHDKIIEAASHEFTELSQYQSTMKEQFRSLESLLRSAMRMKKIPPKMRVEWKKRAAASTAITSQMETTAQAWTDDMLSSEFFYGPVFKLVRGSIPSLKKYTELGNSFFSQNIPADTFRIQEGQVSNEMDQSLSAVQTKLDWIKTAPKTQAGLPTRGGL